MSSPKIQPRARPHRAPRALTLCILVLVQPLLPSISPYRLLAAESDSRPAQRLTLAQATERALREHPRMAAAELRAKAAQQFSQQTRATLLPALSANVVAVGTADPNTRLAALPGLNNPAIFERVAAGLNLSQLITDFGKSSRIHESAQEKAKAESENAQLVRNQLVLWVSAAYFACQQAQGIVKVADQTVDTRKLLLEQLETLARNGLKSELDSSFARIALGEAQLLQLKAQNDLSAAFATLSTLVGEKQPVVFDLEEIPAPGSLPADPSPWILEALQSRPDLARLRAERNAALLQARADRAAHWPTLHALASVGTSPLRDDRLEQNYAAAGLALNLPLFSGGRDTARQREAEFRAQAADASLKEEEQNIARELRIALLRARHGAEKLTASAQLRNHARIAHDLASSRFQLGSATITELSQAQLALVTAEIGEISSRYEYLLLRATLDFQRGVPVEAARPEPPRSP